MTEPQLNADETAYIIYGKEYARATSILAGYFKGKNFKQEHLDRGKAVHKLAEWVLPGHPIPFKIHPILAGYRDALKRFVAETEFVCEAMELIVWSRLYQIAGQLDCLCTIRGAKAILDIKSGKAQKPPATTELQTAIYRQGYEERTKDKGRKRYGLQVRPDGTYRLVNYDKKAGAFQHDLNIYVSMLNKRRWERDNGYA